LAGGVALACGDGIGGAADSSAVQKKLYAHSDREIIEKREALDVLLSLKTEILKNHNSNKVTDLQKPAFAKAQGVPNVPPYTYVPFTGHGVNIKNLPDIPCKVPMLASQNMVITNVPYCQFVEKVPDGSPNVQTPVASKRKTENKSYFHSGNSIHVNDTPVDEYADEIWEEDTNSSHTSDINSNISTIDSDNSIENDEDMGLSYDSK